MQMDSGGGLGAHGSDDWTCPTCFEHREERCVFQCSHIFCMKCTKKIYESHANHISVCPLCRHPCHRNATFRVMGTRRVKTEGKGVHQPEPNPPEGEALLSVKVQGDWMSKIEGLVRRILYIQANQPGEKCLVFSNYERALALVKKALVVNQVKHASLEGQRQNRRKSLKAFNEDDEDDTGTQRESLKAFSGDDEVMVMLLVMKKDAAGLTLVRANHVFLLEPSLDPAQEQQAIARVHRIGQQQQQQQQQHGGGDGGSHGAEAEAEGADAMEGGEEFVDAGDAACEERLAEGEADDLLNAMMLQQ
eukprot:gene12662-15896_t